MTCCVSTMFVSANAKVPIYSSEEGMDKDSASIIGAVAHQERM